MNVLCYFEFHLYEIFFTKKRERNFFSISKKITEKAKCFFLIFSDSIANLFSSAKVLK